MPAYKFPGGGGCLQRPETTRPSFPPGLTRYASPDVGIPNNEGSPPMLFSIAACRFTAAVSFGAIVARGIRAAARAPAERV